MTKTKILVIVIAVVVALLISFGLTYGLVYVLGLLFGFTCTIKRVLLVWLAICLFNALFRGNKK